AQIERPSHASLEVDAEHLVGEGAVECRCRAAVPENRKVDLRRQMRHRPVPTAHPDSNQRRDGKAFASILGQRHEDAALDVELEAGGRRDEAVELKAIAPIELDVAGVEETTRTGVEELEPLRSGRRDESSGENSLLLTGETHRDSVRAVRVTED